MNELRLRIADLRRAKGLTQGQLADIVGVSFQTISKWENGGAMPDITYLPVLAKYFDVSVDQLMGLVPLPNEEYIPAVTETAQFWKQKMEYLIRSRKNSFVRSMSGTAVAVSASWAHWLGHICLKEAPIQALT